MLRHPIRRALVVTTLAILGCRGGRRGPPPERFVPAAIRAAIVVPETGRAARELADLHASVSGFPGAGELAGARGALAAQLGFDPLDQDALADAGVDPRRGAAVAVLDVTGPGGEPGSATLVVLPAADAPKVERLLARIARDRLGATERSSETHGGVAAVVFRRPGSAAASLTYAVVEHTTLLTTHPSGPALVAGAAALGPAASLAEVPAWKLARAALGDRIAALAFVPAGSRLLRGMWAVADGLAIGVSAGPGRLLARAAVLLGAREPSFRALAADGNAAPLVARLDPAAPLAARWDGDFAALGRKLVPMLGARDRERLAVYEDRDRIARDLHDLVIQRLFAIGLGLQGTSRLVSRPDVAGRLAGFVGDLDETIAEVRRTIFALQNEPSADATSLRAQILAAASEAQAPLGFEPHVRFVGPIDSLADDDARADLIGTLREALANVARHAHAGTAQVSARADPSTGLLELVVTDDGVGIDPAQTRRSGLANLADRAERHGGTLTVDTGPDGTTLTWRIPVLD